MLGVFLLSFSHQASLQTLAASFDGRIGIAVIDGAKRTSVHGKDRFSLQSVMKLVVSAAVMDAVDRMVLRLDQTIVARRADMSVNVQPIEKLVGPNGYRTTVGDLVRRAIVDSDSAATDILFARVGGAPGIMRFLRGKVIAGIRIDRNERQLQSETVGVVWRPEYVHPALYRQAQSRVSKKERRAAFERYRRDIRDTATPEAMAGFLDHLARGSLLSPRSTKYLRGCLADCKTFPNRLKAGTPPGWITEHKTGSSGTLDGLTVATNDVGLLIGPDGRTIAIAVFVADSKRPEKERSAFIASVAKLATRG